MADTAICVENLGKLYHIGRRLERFKTLRDVLSDALVAPFRKAGKLLRGQATGAAELDETVWALRDVSFGVERGEVLGIIGPNGAGKTTLLKILSRITEPTEGFADVYGRVGSLLEVGTGFHLELTGRENVYLNGAILGMKRTEIDRKFDEIVGFAGVERFIDTPTKHYSRGMRLRLGFAVAAHLEPEILLIDEVLAVGDAAFQKRCLSKMQDVGREGRTVLFVSHNMPAITRLCPRTVLLDTGRVIMDGPSSQVVAAYLNSGVGTTAAREWPDLTQAPGDSTVRLRAVRVRTEDGRIGESIDIRQPVGIEMEYEVFEAGHVLLPHFKLFSQDGTEVFNALDVDPDWRGRPRPAGRYSSTGWIPGNFLAEGMMFIGVAMVTLRPRTRHFLILDAVAFQVVDTTDGDSARGDWAGGIAGVVRPLLEWTTQFTPNQYDCAAKEKEVAQRE